MKLPMLLLAVPLMTSCAAVTSSGDSMDVEAIVRAFDDEERLAALNRDVAALQRLWSDNFVVNAPNNQVVVGKEANLNAFVRSGIINFSTFDRTIEAVQVDRDHVAIMGLETVVPRTDAPSAGLVAGQAVQRRFTNIWRREGDTWKLFWRHANVLPRR